MSMDILKKVGCLTENYPEFKVFEVENIQPADRWDDIFQKHDVVVAHPNSISLYYKKISPIPTECIDALFMYEAHHEATPTWKAINT